jgi:hypothetical protein
MDNRPPAYLRFPGVFVVLLALSTYRLKPWTWKLSEAPAVFVGVILGVGLAAAGAWLLAASARLGMRLARAGRDEQE